MNKDLFPLPEPHPVVRNGESVVEFTQHGDVVAEFNISRLLKNLFDALKSDGTNKLEVLP